MEAWNRRPVVWLSGVRRVGKTTLAEMLPQARYQNCDLPSVVRGLEDPEPFFDSLKKGEIVVFDEIHRLADPSRVLKIAADVYPQLRVLATGSSTLAATKKFRDGLTGRKTMIYLPPVLWAECLVEFGLPDLDRRLQQGGLPEPLLSGDRDLHFYAEWMDSFYARDIQELFAIRNRTGFLKLLQLLLRRSGGLLDYTNLAKLSGQSRPTIMAHVEAMQIARAVFLLPPFHGGGRRELTRRPKGYVFDTGFVAFAGGWEKLREEDRGLLWEHLVLDTLRAHLDEQNLFYWRDKSGREIDFIVRGSGGKADAIECKINPDHFDPSHLVFFRSHYPEGRNYLISPITKNPFRKRFGKLEVRFGSTGELEELKSATSAPNRPI